jgi:hypothetical protein
MTRNDGAGGADLSIEDTVKAKARLHQGQPVTRFDPYQGAMSTKPPSKKRDLRKLGVRPQCRESSLPVERLS